MLQTLHVENIAVIEKADIELAPGMNVLTGETGAGKSMLIDALGAVLGGRTPRDIVRRGASAASVTAVFDISGAEQWCEENGIDIDDGELILSRRITADGKNACRVNGVPVAVAQLKELGSLLLDIHGQSAGQRLTDEKTHREYLDSFGGLDALVADFRGKYSAYCATLDEIDSLQMDESEKERRADVLRFQIDELERAKLVPGEIEEKTARRELVKNSVKLTDYITAAFEAMYGGDRSDGAVSLISSAEADVSASARYAPELSELGARLSELRYNAEDIAEELRDFRDSLEFSPEELDELEARLDLLKRLSRKYGDSEDAMLAFLDNAREELDALEYSTEHLEKLQIKLEQQREAAGLSAKALSAARKDAAKLLESRITGELQQLSMPGAKFYVNFEPVHEDVGFGAWGCDDISFIMSANAGEEAGKISRIASGGELARIMLAMKNVLAENDAIQTMVFDEIDTGVSGIAAQRVGEKMCRLARIRQVICVTHLPQIAAMADAQFEIVKTERDGRTFTRINRLNDDGRKHELARLIGGENITDTTLASAEEQLAAAEKYRLSL